MISQYRKPEYKQCSLDVVNAACYLAFLAPIDAMDMNFTTEYMYARRKQLMEDEDVDDLVSMNSDDYSNDNEDVED